MATFYRCDRCRAEIADVSKVWIGESLMAGQWVELCEHCYRGLKHWLLPVSADAAVRELAKRKPR